MCITCFLVFCQPKKYPTLYLNISTFILLLFVENISSIYPWGCLGASEAGKATGPNSFCMLHLNYDCSVCLFKEIVQMHNELPNYIKLVDYICCEIILGSLGGPCESSEIAPREMHLRALRWGGCAGSCASPGVDSAQLGAQMTW